MVSTRQPHNTNQSLFTRNSACIINTPCDVCLPNPSSDSLSDVITVLHLFTTLKSRCWFYRPFCSLFTYSYFPFHIIYLPYIIRLCIVMRCACVVKIQTKRMYLPITTKTTTTETYIGETNNKRKSIPQSGSLWFRQHQRCLQWNFPVVQDTTIIQSYFHIIQDTTLETMVRSHHRTCSSIIIRWYFPVLQGTTCVPLYTLYKQSQCMWKWFNLGKMTASGPKSNFSLFRSTRTHAPTHARSHARTRTHTHTHNQCSRL